MKYQTVIYNLTHHNNCLKYTMNYFKLYGINSHLEFLNQKTDFLRLLVFYNSVRFYVIKVSFMTNAFYLINYWYSIQRHYETSVAMEIQNFFPSLEVDMAIATLQCISQDEASKLSVFRLLNRFQLFHLEHNFCNYMFCSLYILPASLRNNY